MDVEQISHQDTNLNRSREETDLHSLPPHDKPISLEQNRHQDTAVTNCDLHLVCEENKVLDESNAISKDAPSSGVDNSSPYKIPELRNMFGSLLKEVWSGEWSTLRPVPFKDTLEIFHPQFRGAHQQDCQVI